MDDTCPNREEREAELKRIMRQACLVLGNVYRRKKQSQHASRIIDQCHVELAELKAEAAAERWELRAGRDFGDTINNSVGVKSSHSSIDADYISSTARSTRRLPSLEDYDRHGHVWPMSYGMGRRR